MRLLLVNENHASLIYKGEGIGVEVTVLVKKNVLNDLNCTCLQQICVCVFVCELLLNQEFDNTQGRLRAPKVLIYIRCHEVIILPSNRLTVNPFSLEEKYKESRSG